jgi:uridine kinase
MSTEHAFVIGVGGPSGSGKTTIAKRLATALGARVLSLESYYHDLSGLKPEERAGRNFDHPDALDAGLLIQQVKSFSEGQDIRVPVYDFAAHTRVLNKTELVRSGPALIVEGILVLSWPELRARFDISFYLDAADAVCFQRRMVRDIVERQRTHEFVHRQYQKTVLPMAIEHVYPTRDYADFVIDAAQDIPSVETALLSRIQFQPRWSVATQG